MKKEGKGEQATEPPKSEGYAATEADAELAPTDADATLVKEEEKDTIEPSTPHQRNPSMSIQSKMRSSSFRQNAGAGPLSPSMVTSPVFGPDGDTASSIYLKQATRIDELERDNKRLAKEAADAERRWKKAEEELEVLREADGGIVEQGQRSPDAGEVEKLVSRLSKRIHVEDVVNHQTAC